ncbi:MAG: hypothetical protein WD231_02990 [Candidatus Woykebacteria bacterium]
MRGLLSTASITFIWIVFTIFLLFSLLFFFSKLSGVKNLDLLLSSTSKNVFASPVDAISAPREILAAVQANDARVALVERFLRKNGSPMLGSEKIFIEAADKYDLDWRLLPAIAFQESTLGKNTPFGSYNAFGWGVTDGGIVGASFQSWDQAIKTVAKGLREGYLDKGLKTPETINPYYAGDKNWNVKVRFAMEEIVD